MSLAPHVSGRRRSFSSGSAQSALFRIAIILIVSLVSLFATKSELFAQEYFWSDGITVNGNTARGSVAGVGYTITASQPISTTLGMWEVTNFPDIYKVPGDTGASPAVAVFQESLGSTYTLTFDQPVEQPLVAIASLGSAAASTVFNFGSSVNILWSSNVSVNNGTASSTTSVTGAEGYLVARYSGTVQTITFSVPVGEFYMNLIMGFEVSTTPPEITAPGGNAGDATAAITVDELQTSVGDWDANKAVNWSITGGTDSDLFSIDSSTGELSFLAAPDFLSPSDADQDNVYVVEVTATDLQTIAQSASQTVSVTVSDATAPTVSSVSVPADGIYGLGGALNFTVNLSEAVTVDETGGVPSIALDIGGVARQAEYLSGSGTSALTFRYTVQADDVDADGISVTGLALNGGTIRDAAENDLVLTLNSVGSTAAVLVGHGSATKLVVTTAPVAGASGSALATQPVIEIQEATVHVTSSSGFSLRKVFYTVPSRLIGHSLKARIFDDRIELLLAGRHIETLPRGRAPKGGRGPRAHVINYRHIIHSLRQKPGALADLVYRDQLFPRSEYRRCWDTLMAAMPRSDASRLMVELLWLAHDQACEADLAAALTTLLDAGRMPDLQDLRARFQRPKAAPEDVSVDIPPTATYDALLASREMAA